MPEKIPFSPHVPMEKPWDQKRDELVEKLRERGFPKSATVVGYMLEDQFQQLVVAMNMHGGVMALAWTEVPDESMVKALDRIYTVGELIADGSLEKRRIMELTDRFHELLGHVIKE